MKRRNVLIADDEKLFIKSLIDGLKPFQSTLNCNVLTASNGREAMQILDSGPVEMVITDIRMPEADGFKLITHMINNYPSVPVVVMTAFGSQDIEKKVRELGIVRYLEKPIDFDMLLKTIEEVLNLDKKEGRIEGIALSTFLQMMEMEKVTCTLTITSKERTGIFHIKGGNLLEAEYGGAKGEDAALEILTWGNVKINMKEVCKIREGSISQSLTHLLLESFRIMDSKRKQREEKEREKTKEFAVTDTQLLGGKTKADDPLPAMIDMAKLNRGVENMKKNLSGSLLATDIIHLASGQSLVGWNADPTISTMLSAMTRTLISRLPEIPYPPLGRYMLLHLADKRILIVIPNDEYQWHLLVDGTRAQLGLLLNVVIPQAIRELAESKPA